MSYLGLSEEELLDLIDEWHEGNSGMMLHQYLGWSQEQYDYWLEGKHNKK